MFQTIGQQFSQFNANLKAEINSKSIFDIQFKYNQQKMSNNRIFSAQQQQREMPGRNANIGSIMAKRSPIFNHNAERQESSPFEGYNCKSVETIFSTSQVSQFNGEGFGNNISILTIKKVVREELDKMNLEDKKRQLGMLQAQINDLKDKVHENHKHSLQQIYTTQEEIKSNIHSLVLESSKESQKEIKINLRKVFEKTSEELKKDIFKHIEKQYVPISFIDDVRIKISEIFDKIDSFDEQLATAQFPSQHPPNKQTQIQSIPSIPLAFQSKITKIQREVQNHKKICADLNQKIKQLDESNTQFNKSMEKISQNEEYINSSSEKIKQLSHEFEIVSKKLTNLEHSNNLQKGDFQNLRDKLSEMEQYINEQRYMIKDLHKKYSSTEFKEEKIQKKIQIQPIEIEKASTSIILNNTSENIMHHDKQDKHQTQNSQAGNLTFENLNLSQSTDLNTSEVQRYEESSRIMKKKVYQIDPDGFLMDGDGKYLLSPSNQMIKLPEDKIGELSRSGLIEQL